MQLAEINININDIGLDEFISFVKVLRNDSYPVINVGQAKNMLALYLLTFKITDAFEANINYLRNWKGISDATISDLFSKILFNFSKLHINDRVQYLYEKLFYKKLTDLVYTHRLYHFYLPIFILLSNMDYYNRGDEQYNKRMKYLFIKYVLKEPKIFILQPQILQFLENPKLKEKLYAKKVLMEII